MGRKFIFTFYVLLFVIFPTKLIGLIAKWELSSKSILENSLLPYELCLLQQAKLNQLDPAISIHEQPVCAQYLDESINSLPRRCWFGSRQQRIDNGICMKTAPYVNCRTLQDRSGFWKHWSNISLTGQFPSIGFAADFLSTALQRGFQTVSFTGDSMSIQMAQRLVCSFLRVKAGVGNRTIDKTTLSPAPYKSTSTTSTIIQIPREMRVELYGNFFSLTGHEVGAQIINFAPPIHGRNQSIYVTIHRMDNGIGLAFQPPKRLPRIPEIDKICDGDGDGGEKGNTAVQGGKGGKGGRIGEGVGIRGIVKGGMKKEDPSLTSSSSFSSSSSSFSSSSSLSRSELEFEIIGKGVGGIVLPGTTPSDLMKNQEKEERERRGRERDGGLGLGNVTCRREYAEEFIYTRTISEFLKYKNPKKWSHTLHLYVLPVISKREWEYRPLISALTYLSPILSSSPLFSRMMLLSPLAQHFNTHPQGLYVNITRPTDGSKRPLVCTPHSSIRPPIYPPPLTTSTSFTTSSTTSSLISSSLESSESTYDIITIPLPSSSRSSSSSSSSSYSPDTLSFLSQLSLLSSTTTPSISSSTSSCFSMFHFHSHLLPLLSQLSSTSISSFSISAPFSTTLNSSPISFEHSFKYQCHNLPSSLSSSSTSSSTSSSSIGVIDVYRWSIPYFDLHPESGSTGWIHDCTHYGYHPLMYEGMWKEINEYLRDEWK